MENKTLKVKVVGDSGPFSRLGKSIGYHLVAGEAEFLVDCGAPVFKALGDEGLNDIDGIVGTHAHEDHKRWFTDIALYNKFTNSREQKLELLAAPEIISDYRRASAAALEQTLSNDAQRVVNYELEDYVQPRPISPRPLYRIVRDDSGDTEYGWKVVGTEGKTVSPDRARVIVPKKNVDRPRMIFKDPELNEWVEPQAFYSFNDSRFYDQDSYQTYTHPNGLKIKPFKSTAWHGPFTTSLLFEWGDKSVFFSSDTRFYPDLWEQLVEPVEPEAKLDTGEFAGEPVVEDANINNFLERIWGEKRLETAMDVYDPERNFPMIHDVSGPWAQVHTDYRDIVDRQGRVLLTHSPDVFTTVHPMAHLGKTFIVGDRGLVELSEEERQFEIDALCYHKSYSDFYVGYADPDGDHYLVKLEDNTYDIVEEPGEAEEVVERVQLYVDIGGDYYPYLNGEREEYYRRPDGKVVRLTHDDDGSTGEIVEGRRGKLSN